MIVVVIIDIFLKVRNFIVGKRIYKIFCLVYVIDDIVLFDKMGRFYSILYFFVFLVLFGRGFFMRIFLSFLNKLNFFFNLVI